MRVEHYPELLEIVKDLKYIVRNTEYHKLLLNRQNEKSPLGINLSFSPVISEKTVEEFTKYDVCTSCAQRISYKSEQFAQKSVKLPFMVLIHNSFILSPKKFYEVAEEDKIFRNMIQGALKCGTNELLVREVLRCYFDPSDEKNPEFTQNCIKHIRKDIDQYKIRGLLILGQAAPLLFGGDAEKIKQVTGKIIEWEGLPTMICPGPNRIQYMIEKKFDPEKIRAEKQSILNYLSLFKKEVMKIP